jgi:uncharacterized membrane protein
MKALVLCIDAFGSLIVAASVAKVLWLLLRTRSISLARVTLSQGVLFGLSFKVAATLLTIIVLETWTQIGVFAAVFALRTVLRRVFAWELLRTSGSAPTSPRAHRRGEWRRARA